MAEKTLESVKEALAIRQEFSKTGLKRVLELEGVIDRYEDKLGTYIFKITSANLDDEQSRDVNKYLRVLSDFERMSDHARNVGEAVQEIQDKKVNFSEMADKELRVLENAIGDITDMTINAFINNDRALAMRIEPLEEVVDDLCDEIKANHIERVSRQECTLENGFVFNDLLTDYERISDHCSNIAVDIIESGPEGIKLHEYHMKHDYRSDEEFQKYFNEYKEKYSF
jgi:phosphate:Na+ symporter